MEHLNLYGLCDYEEGKDFVVERNKKVEHRIISYKFFFRNTQGNLLGYIKLHISFGLCIAPLKQELVNVDIIDTISASSFGKNFTETRQQFFRDNGYEDDVYLENFWPTMLTSVLSFIKDNYPEERLVNIVSKQNNVSQVSKLISKTQHATIGLVEKFSWWNPQTIFLS